MELGVVQSRDIPRGLRKTLGNGGGEKLWSFKGQGTEGDSWERRLINVGDWGHRRTPHKGDKKGSLTGKGESNAGGLGGHKRSSPVRGGDPEGLQGDLWVAKGSRMGLLDTGLSPGSG